MTGLTRRRFLGLAGGAAGAAAAGTLAWTTFVRDQVESERDRAARGARPGRLLVVIELGGGNDGLNTLVPADGRYRDARPTLAVPEADVLTLDGQDDVGLHPALAPLLPLWGQGRFAGLQGIGFGGQTRSHFAATDVWRAGGQWPFATSWLGRWLDATAGGEQRPLRAVALGADTRVLAAQDSLSTVVREPATFRLLTPGGATSDAGAVVDAFAATASPLDDGELLAAAQRVIPATLEAVTVLDQASARSARAGAAPQAGVYDQFTPLLETAARIVELDVGTEVIVVGASGFDTHARQADTHAQLLADVATGVRSFLDRVEQLGRGDDVLVLTTSEFGRRVAENGSLGTDHGLASTQFAFGPLPRSQVTGELGFDDLVDGDLPVAIDTRALYAIGLDWLGGPTEEVLEGSFQRVDLS